MNKFLKLISVAVLCTMLIMNTQCAFAKQTSKSKDKITYGKVTPKSIGAGALSLLVWPGIGQAVNDNKGEKVLTHALLGITQVYRVWSCYDAVVDRKGGYWEGRI